MLSARAGEKDSFSAWRSLSISRSAASIAPGVVPCAAQRLSETPGIRSCATPGRGASGVCASAGPCEPDGYCGSGPGVASHFWTIGSQMRHCASTSSLRVKSVASPRMASMISRS